MTVVRLRLIGDTAEPDTSVVIAGERLEKRIRLVGGL